MFCLLRSVRAKIGGFAFRLKSRSFWLRAEGKGTNKAPGEPVGIIIVVVIAVKGTIGMIDVVCSY